LKFIDDKLESVDLHLKPLLILDPHNLSSAQVAASFAEYEEVTDWFGLRRYWEWECLDGERHPRPVVIRVVDSSVRTQNDVPWDIARQATVVNLTTHFSDDIALLLLEIPERIADGLFSSKNDTELLRNAARHYGVDLRHDATAIEQLKAAITLLIRIDIPEPVRHSVIAGIKDPATLGLIHGDPVTELQDAWDAWLVDSDDPAAKIINDLGPSLSSLFSLQVLRPGTASRDLPSWASIGVTSRSDDDEMEVLLKSVCDDDPDDLNSWIRFASEWGKIRHQLATATMSDGLIHTAQELHQSRLGLFENWIQENYGPLLTTSPAWPVTVHKVNDFLRSRMTRGEAERIVLLVLDGLGLSQWAQIEQSGEIEILEATPIMAVIPTVTSISRQAIFAGRLPREFSDTLGSNVKEGERWRTYWRDSVGLANHEIEYSHTDGFHYERSLGIGNYKVQGIAALAIDKLVHSAGPYLDRQLTAGVEYWLREGFLKSLAEEARTARAELWITSDHGNMVCNGIGAFPPGVLGATASVRAQGFESETARSASSAPGIDWNTGLPDNLHVRMAERDGAFIQSGQKRITHGGISFEEVFVPFARIA